MCRWFGFWFVWEFIKKIIFFILIGLYDESGTFFGAMGRYSNGDKTYEKSYYLSLWSAPAHLIRDLKLGRVKLIEPRLQMSLNSHPWAVVSTLISKSFDFY